jgi:hypothetical protein
MDQEIDLRGRKLRGFARRGDPGNAVRAIVAAAFALVPEKLVEATRGAPRAAFARQVGMYVATTTLGLNLTEAGALFGRDRTTAAHACRTIEERREDRAIDSVVDCVERAVGRLVALHRRTGADYER